MTTGITAQLPVVQFLDNNGKPAAGFSLYTYLAGTTTPVTTYQDQGLSIANTNPIVLNSRGECSIWLDATKGYKLVLKDKSDAIVLTQDNIYFPLPDGSVTTSKIADGAVTAAKLADASIPDKITDATSKTTPVDADTVGIVDSADGWKLKKLTFSNLATWIKSFCLPLSGGTLTGPLKKSIGTAIASAATLNLTGREGGDVLHITGTTPVTSVNLGAGDSVLAIADAALPITASATLLIDGVSSGSTYTCAANDRVLFVGDSSSVRVQVISYAGVSAPVSSVNSRTGAVTTLVQGTAVATTSGTAIDFTGLPSWVKRITVMFSGVSTSGTSYPQIQLGSGSILTTGYSGYGGFVGGGANYSSGFALGSGAAADVRHIVVSICTLGSNVWLASLSGGFSSTTNFLVGGGSVTLSGTLDRIRITTVNGTDTFDAGSVNILYEG